MFSLQATRPEAEECFSGVTVSTVRDLPDQAIEVAASPANQSEVDQVIAVLRPDEVTARPAKNLVFTKTSKNLIIAAISKDDIVQAILHDNAQNFLRPISTIAG